MANILLTKPARSNPILKMYYVIYVWTLTAFAFAFLFSDKYPQPASNFMVLQHLNIHSILSVSLCVCACVHILSMAKLWPFCGLFPKTEIYAFELCLMASAKNHSSHSQMHKCTLNPILYYCCRLEYSKQKLCSSFKSQLPVTSY